MTSKVATVETTSSDSSPKSSPGAEVEIIANNAGWKKKVEDQMTAMQNSMNVMLNLMTSVSQNPFLNLFQQQQASLIGGISSSQDLVEVNPVVNPF